MNEKLEPTMLKGVYFTIDEIKYTRDNNKLLRINIELCAGRCNLRCVYCYAQAGKKISNSLTDEEIFNIIDQAKNLGQNR